jgi:hypothetical protein
MKCSEQITGDGFRGMLGIMKIPVERLPVMGKGTADFSQKLKSFMTGVIMFDAFSLGFQNKRSKIDNSPTVSQHGAFLLDR